MLRYSSIRQAQAAGIRIDKPKAKRKRKIVHTKATWEVIVLPGVTKITIPENMPSLNVWKNWHPMKQHEYKKYLTDQVTLLNKKDRPATLDKAVVQVVHYHKKHRNRDDDNYTPKFLGDSLRYAGFIKEDTSEVLTWDKPIFRQDKEKWRTEVWIYAT